MHVQIESTTTLRPPPSASIGETTSESVPGLRGHIGRIVAATMLGGLVLSIVAVVGPFAGAEEPVISGAALAVFAASWALLANLTARRTDQPQTWAYVPATVMAVAAATILVFAPTGNQAGWIWPPAIVALVVWMVVRSRRALRSRARVLVLYPVFAGLALSAVGGVYETYSETNDPTAAAMPGRLVDVGGHKLHIDCTGTGSPTVVLEAGLGDVSTIMSSWVAPSVAHETRVCVYDRAGRGWSESAGRPQNGEQVATDLHTLLTRAGERGPFVMAGHSAGGIYVLNFAKLFPHDVAGVVLLDSMHPQQYQRMASWPGFYEMYRRATATMPVLARLGVGRVLYGPAYSNLPNPQRDQEPAFLSSPRFNRSLRDEFRMIRTAMNQAAELHTLGNTPLMVLTATKDADPDWPAMQRNLMTLSTDAAQRVVHNASHAMLVGDKAAARQSSAAIVAVVGAVRTNTLLNTKAG